MSATPWLDVLIGLRKFYAAGVELVARSKINFGTGITATDNPTLERTDVSVDISHVTMAGDVTGTAAAAVVGKIRGVTVSSTAPSEGQFPYYDSETSTLKYIDPPVIYGGTPAQAAARAAFYGEIWGGPIRIAPLSTGADDWLRAQAVWNACAGKWPVHHTTGDWVCKTVGNVPNASKLVFDPGSFLDVQLTPGVGEDQCPFLMTVTLAGAGDTTVHTANTPGTRTLRVAAAVAEDAIIQVRSAAVAFRTEYFTVKACAGVSAPYTLTLDDVIYDTYSPGDTVKIVSHMPSDVHVEAYGSIWSGTCDRFFEGEALQRGSVRGATILSESDGPVIAADVGGKDIVFEDLDIDCGGTATAGIAAESITRFRARNVCVDRFVICGAWVLDNFGCPVIEDCTFQSGGVGSVGIQIGADGSNLGSHDAIVRGGSVAHTPSGILVSSGSKRVKIDKVAFINCTNGVNFDVAGSPDPSQTLITGCSFVGGTNGIAVQSGVKQTQIRDCMFDSVSNAAINIVDECDISGVSITGSTYAVYSNTTQHWYVDKANIVVGSGKIGFTSAAAETLHLSNCIMTVAGGTAFGIYPQGGGTVELRDVRMTVASHGYGLYMGSNSTLIDHGNLQLSGAGTLLTLVDATAHANFGTFVANQTTPVTITNRLAKAGMGVCITLHTVGGTVGALPRVVAITAGTSFDVNASASDTSTYSYTIQRARS